MAIESYVAAPDIGGLFVGMGVLVVCIVGSYWLYQLARMYRSMIDKEVKYDLLEEMTLDRLAKKKGIDLEKEVLKRDVFRQKKKSYRRKIQEEIYEELFGKDKEEKKQKEE